MGIQHFDLVVVGSGPAGQKAALGAAKLGKRVAIVDREYQVGGTCLHNGTIPSKAIREAAFHLSATNERRIYGANYAVKHNITMQDLLQRANYVIRTEVEVIHSQMERNNVRMIFGTASFVDAATLRVVGGSETIDISADHILLACGSEPTRPANVPFTPGRVIDSNGLLELDHLPKSLIVIGGGVVGTEYASVMASVGVKVTLVDARPRLLEFLDDEIAENLQFRLRDMGVRLKLGEMLSKIEFVGAREVQATLESGKVLHAETILHCIGRQGATGQLNLAAAGLAADDRGRLKVNEYLQTSVPHIYAAGDIIGFPALAATSMEQGRMAASHMFHELQAPSQPCVPYGIYTIPELSMVGQTEQQLTVAKIPYEVGIARYREIARGQLMADPHGLLKLLFHVESHRLLGVHCIGTGATELIHVGQAILHAGLPIEYFVETVFNYPTLGECYKVAALDGLNRASRKVVLGEEDEAAPTALPTQTAAPMLAAEKPTLRAA